jgi:hypothetical protein
MTSLTKIKTINSCAGYARWLSETSEEPIAYLARVQVEEIPSPYAYSPVKPVYEWNGKRVISFETRHRHYEVYEVSPQLLSFKSDDEASDWNSKRE